MTRFAVSIIDQISQKTLRSVGVGTGPIEPHWNNFLMKCRLANKYFHTVETSDRTNELAVMSVDPGHIDDLLVLHALLRASSQPSQWERIVGASTGLCPRNKTGAHKYFAPLSQYLNPAWEMDVFILEVDRARRALEKEGNFTPLADYNADRWTSKILGYLDACASADIAHDVDNGIGALHHNGAGEHRNGEQKVRRMRKRDSSELEPSVAEEDTAALRALIIPPQVTARIQELLGIVEILSKAEGTDRISVPCSKDDLANALFVRALQSDTVVKGVMTRLQRQLAIASGTVVRRLEKLTAEVADVPTLTRVYFLRAAVLDLPVHGELPKLLEAVQRAEPMKAVVRSGHASSSRLTAVKDAEGNENEYDGLKIYTRQAFTAPLLTPEDEIAVHAAMYSGSDANRDAAREKMILANLRLVLKIAWDYYPLLPILDLVNEGNIGLMKAVDRYDPGKGRMVSDGSGGETFQPAKLSTYAGWWIKQGIKRAIANQSRDIRLPVHMIDKLRKLDKAIKTLEAELGDATPTSEQIAEVMGEGWTAEKVEQTTARGRISTTSLDAQLSPGESETTRSEVFEDEKVMGADDAAAGSDQRDLLVRALSSSGLEERDCKILDARFGLSHPDGMALTLEEVGEKFGVTRERIRQLQNIALEKLRKYMKQHGSEKAEVQD